MFLSSSPGEDSLVVAVEDPRSGSVLGRARLGLASVQGQARRWSLSLDTAGDSDTGPGVTLSVQLLSYWPLTSSHAVPFRTLINMPDASYVVFFLDNIDNRLLLYDTAYISIWLKTFQSWVETLLRNEHISQLWCPAEPRSLLSIRNDSNFPRYSFSVSDDEKHHLSTASARWPRPSHSCSVALRSSTRRRLFSSSFHSLILQHDARRDEDTRASVTECWVKVLVSRLSYSALLVGGSGRDV